MTQQLQIRERSFSKFKLFDSIISVSHASHILHMSTSYPPPVDKLLTYGDCRNFRDWPDYLALGFTHEHVDDLIRMGTSEELNWADSDSPEVWAPIHAWRVLGQLKAEAAITPPKQEEEKEEMRRTCREIDSFERGNHSGVIRVPKR